MDTKNGTGGIARNISATLQSLQAENEQLRAGYDAARQEIASLKAQPYDQQAMGLCHVCGWKGVIDYPDGPVCVACEHDKTLSPQPAAQAGEYPAGTGNPEADRIIGRLASSDPDFDDCADAVALIHKLVAEIKGPDGFDTWKDAAIADRAARGAAQAAPSNGALAAPAQLKAVGTGGWMRDGALLYRLTDECRPTNFDEIRVTMANGSRDIGQMSAQAERLLVMLSAPQPAAQAVPVDAAVQRESQYNRGFRHGYNRRDAEVKGALA